MSERPPSVLTRQITSLQHTHSTERVVIFAPRPQLGAALKQAATRCCTQAAGLHVTTPEQYAQTVAGLALQARNKRRLQRGVQFFLTLSALQDLTSDQRTDLTTDRPLSGIIRPLMRTFNTLRAQDISPETYARHAAQSARQHAQADAFASYEDLLSKHSVYDTAMLFRTATEQIHSGVYDHTSTVFGVIDTVPLPQTAASFLEALRTSHNGARPDFYRLGSNPASAGGTEAPPPSPPASRAAAHFPTAPYPPNASAAPSPVGRAAVSPSEPLTQEEATDLRFWTATGARREVQAVLEDIVAQDRALDTVEIAFTTQEPYLSLLDGMAERYEIPLSLSTGREIEATRPGQALRGFFEWIADGFPVEELIHLLRSGLVQFDTPIGDEGEWGPLSSSTAARVLAQKRYPRGPEGYVSVLEKWQDELDEEIDELTAVESDESWVDETRQDLQEKKATVEAALSSVRALLQAARVEDRRALDPSSFADGAIEFLQSFGPTPKPTAPEEERTHDEVARNQLLDRLQHISQTDDLPAQPLRRVARQMTSWLDLRPNVRARRPLPGRAHVVLLESAGYANRDHLYVIGLDAASTSSVLTDDPLLTDDERQDLADVAPHLPLRQAQADTDAWLAARALGRHEGSVTLCASTHDLLENEDLFEAPLYLRLQEAARGEKEASESDVQRTHHSLATDATRALAPLDCWTSHIQPKPSVVSEVLSSTYSWIQDGLEAAEARTSSGYTVYDGLLASGSYHDLNPLDQSHPVSAGQLETYAQAPFAYFLRHVLDVEPLDEPALDDQAWLDALQRGAVLHDTFKTFMSELERQPTLDDKSKLEDTFTSTLEEKRDDLPPPSEVIYASTKRQLWRDADLFLHAEAHRTDPHHPHQFELGFGYPPHRRQDGDHADAPTLQFGVSSFSLRGRIDRVDRHPDDTVSLWDYKTGSSSTFEDDDLLNEGQFLQWALYAYAYEALHDVPVQSAGYFFTSIDEMGKRMAANPSHHREQVDRVLQQIAAGITAGAFPLTDANPLKYSFNSLFHDFRSRVSQLKAKDWETDRPVPPPLVQD